MAASVKMTGGAAGVGAGETPCAKDPRGLGQGEPEGFAEELKQAAVGLDAPLGFLGHRR
jgi:hypothetical protein